MEVCGVVAVRGAGRWGGKGGVRRGGHGGGLLCTGMVMLPELRNPASGPCAEERKCPLSCAEGANK